MFVKPLGFPSFVTAALGREDRRHSRRWERGSWDREDKPEARAGRVLGGGMGGVQGEGDP